MSSNTATADEPSASTHQNQTETERPYSTHVEPPEVGGETYHRCRDCGREAITAMGGFDAILHADDCRHREESR